MTVGTLAAPLRVGACLSLTGRFARFGVQAAHGLEVWRSLGTGDVDTIIIDDESDRARLRSELPKLARRCDLLLGPYSTLLMRDATDVARDVDGLVWNHGGSGDDVENAAPGHVVSVLAPTSSYAEPFVRYVADRDRDVPLWLAAGRGSFGRQVIDGAAADAERLGLRTVRIRSDSDELAGAGPGQWNLFCAGMFEEDVATIDRLDALDHPPRLVGTVAAGVQEFGRAARRAEGVFGIAQWAPGRALDVRTGPLEPAFLDGYAARVGEPPDYPAVQAAAAAAVAVHCAQLAGSVQRNALWAAATALRTTTMFGPFAIDPGSGAQIGHRPVLLRWTADALESVPGGATKDDAS